MYYLVIRIRQYSDNIIIRMFNNCLDDIGFLEDIEHVNTYFQVPIITSMSYVTLCFTLRLNNMSTARITIVLQFKHCKKKICFSRKCYRTICYCKQCRQTMSSFTILFFVWKCDLSYNTIYYSCIIFKDAFFICSEQHCLKW